MLMAFLPGGEQAKGRDSISRVSDTNEQIAYLRSSAIGVLVDGCVAAFLDNEEEILAGRYDRSLIHSLPDRERSAL